MPAPLHLEQRKLRGPVQRKDYFSAKAVSSLIGSAVAEKLYDCQPLLRNATPSALEEI